MSEDEKQDVAIGLLAVILASIMWCMQWVLAGLLFHLGWKWL